MIGKYVQGIPVMLTAQEILHVAAFPFSFFKLKHALCNEFFTDTELRLMAADFAEAQLPEFEKFYPDDKRPRLAIEAARKFARGEIEYSVSFDAGDAAEKAGLDFDPFGDTCDAVEAAYSAASPVFEMPPKPPSQRCAALTAKLQLFKPI